MIEHPCPFYIRTHLHKGRVMILEEAVSYTLEGETSGKRLMPFFELANSGEHVPLIPL
jgi:hypothetical protein